MKIMHIAPNAVYNDGWGFQENILPKYQRKAGHEVMLVVGTASHGQNGTVHVGEADYVLPDGVRVVRRNFKRSRLPYLTRLRARIPVKDLLEAFAPDLIFFHGLQSASILDCVRYKKTHPSCVIVQDNHLDPNIGFRADTVKQKLFRAYYRRLNRRAQPYVDKVYGVTPWRKTYAEEYFGVDPRKTDVLIMGADDEFVDLAHRAAHRDAKRREWGIPDDRFVVMTGGKLDRKKDPRELMRACAKRRQTELVIFGTVAQEIKEEFDALVAANDNIRYLGWLDASKVYEHFFAAELVVFPGQHSVLWEQACAAKVPCAFKYFDGMEHVDNGGNAVFVHDTSEEGFTRLLDELHFTPAYEAMKRAAQSEATDVYMYSHITQKSLECVTK